MAARNKPAGIRALVYGIAKTKVDIEGLSVSTSAADNPDAIEKAKTGG
jgi:hypothetical protein